jgi:hypothetical protein
MKILFFRLHSYAILLGHVNRSFTYLGSYNLAPLGSDGTIKHCFFNVTVLSSLLERYVTGLDHSIQANEETVGSKLALVDNVALSDPFFQSVYSLIL